MDDERLKELTQELNKLLKGIKPKNFNKNNFRKNHYELFKKFDELKVKIEFKPELISAEGGKNFDYMSYNIDRY